MLLVKNRYILFFTKQSSFHSSFPIFAKDTSTSFIHRFLLYSKKIEVYGNKSVSFRLTAGLTTDFPSWFAVYVSVLLTTTLESKILLSSPFFVKLIHNKNHRFDVNFHQSHEAAFGNRRHFLCLLALGLWRILLARTCTGYLLWKRRNWQMCGKIGFLIGNLDKSCIAFISFYFAVRH